MFSWLNKELDYIVKNEPTARSKWTVLMLYPSIHARLTHKISHYLYTRKHFYVARFLSQRSRHKTGIEIHPGAIIGDYCFMDHGMGIVIGETAIIGNNVTIYHGVTLGANRNTTQKRHPTIGNNVLIGAGAKIIGNITVGDNVKIGSNAVVTRNVRANTTIIGAKQMYLNKEESIEYMI
ncbi:MAG: serine O-acetyltransferase EpsC [Culicoidibacterales bacterium]